MENNLEYLKNKTSIIYLSNEELWCLLNLYAPTRVIGVENPYTGRFIEEIKASEQTALNHLISSGTLHFSEENTLEFSDFKNIRMIEICLNPDQCLWLTVSRGDNQR